MVFSKKLNFLQMKQGKLWIVFNSLLAFISAFIFAKMVIGFARFLVMRYFDGSVIMKNYEILCVSWKYSEIWTKKSVISIYLTGLIVAVLLIVFSSILYTKSKSIRGFAKLWLIWLYVVSINQSIGLFIRDIPFRRDLFHALEWMFIPYTVIITICFLSIPFLIITNIYNHLKFLRMTPSFDRVSSKKKQRAFYTNIAVIPAVIGSLILMMLNGFKIEMFEIVELLVLIFSLLFSYSLMFHTLTIMPRIVKNEPTNKFGLILFVLLCITIGTFYFFRSFF